MSITVVTVHYKTPHLLPSLLDTLQKEPAIHEVVIVDNSPDCPVPDSVHRRERVHYISNQMNVGFAAAVNQGIRSACQRWVAVLNPDCVPLPGCFSSLLQAAMDYGAPLLGPRFYWDEAKTFRLPPATGLSWSDHLTAHCAHRHPMDSSIRQFHWTIRHDRFWSSRVPFPEPFLSGALFLADTQVLASGKSKSLLDPRYFLYFEETDLCVRLLMKGQAPLCVPQAEAVHFWNQSPDPQKPKAVHMEKSREAFWQKHYGAAPSTENLPPARELPTLWEEYDGPSDAPPVFHYEDDGSRSESRFLEFAVSPDFIPFAQADMLDDDPFLFPESIWARLAPGTYYCRVRAEISGVLKVWRWKKR